MVRITTLFTKFFVRVILRDEGVQKKQVMTEWTWIDTSRKPRW